MASLGSLGVERARAEAAEGVEPVTFDWFGSPIRLADEFNQIELVDLMESTQHLDTEDLHAVSAVKNVLRMVIDPDDFDLFWRTAARKRQRLEDLVAVSEVLMEALTARPTPQQSGSSSGLPSTDANSPAVSASPVSDGRPSRPDLVIIREDDAATRAKVQRAAAAAAAQVG